MEPRYLSADQWHQRELFESRIRVQPRMEVALIWVTIAMAPHCVHQSAAGGQSLCERHVTAPPVCVPAGVSPETVPATLVRITSETDSPWRAE